MGPAGDVAPVEPHSPRRLRSPEGWVLYLSPDQPQRLVTFVHGFRGQAIAAWHEFSQSGDVGPWWRESDLLFVGYDSIKENITAVADRLRRELPVLFPRLPDDLAQIGDVGPRDVRAATYNELVLVGHSLGGLIVRRALADCAQEWLDQRTHSHDVPRPHLLSATTRLFSPASSGFRAAGPLGLLQATPGWWAVNLILRRSSAFTDLQPGSELLRATQRRTETLVKQHTQELGALRPSILWANPDDIVLTERYDTDPVAFSVDGKSHSQVCKPAAGYESPWVFVETGAVP